MPDMLRFCRGIPLCIAAVAALVGTDRTAATAPAPGLREYRSCSGIVHTDLPQAEPEIGLRLDAAVKLFADSARQWGDDATPAASPVNLYVFGNADDYHAAGGPTGSTGIFLPDPTAGTGRALVLAGPHITLATWHVLQHEAFHAYAHATIDRQPGPPLPPWLAEGLADYFGEALFTGDGMVAGLVPPWRLARLRARMTAGRLQPLQPLMSLSLQQWRAALGVANYDQAWSVVHFLLCAHGSPYPDRLAAAVRTHSLNALGPIDSLQHSWQRYWESQPPDPTADGYALVIAQTLNAFRVRAAAAGDTFATYDQFRAAAAAGQVLAPAAHWLPPSMLNQAIDAADQSGPCRFTAQQQSAAELSVQSHSGARVSAGYLLETSGDWKLWSRVQTPGTP
jgi:hypothetical protein